MDGAGKEHLTSKALIKVAVAATPSTKHATESCAKKSPMIETLAGMPVGTLMSTTDGITAETTGALLVAWKQSGPK